MMKLEKKHTVYFSLVSGKEMTDKEEDDFAGELEVLMNKYQVFKLDASLNPFEQKLELTNKKDG